MVSFLGSLRRVFYFKKNWLDAVPVSDFTPGSICSVQLDTSDFWDTFGWNHKHCLEWLQSAPATLLQPEHHAAAPSEISELYLLSFWCIYSASSMNISLGPVEHLQSLLANHLCVAAWILSVLLWVGTTHPPPPPTRPNASLISQSLCVPLAMSCQFQTTAFPNACLKYRPVTFLCVSGAFIVNRHL